MGTVQGSTGVTGGRSRLFEGTGPSVAFTSAKIRRAILETLQSPQGIAAALAEQGYLASERIAQVIYLADRLNKPVLAEGPAGVGKTELAKALAGATGRKLVRLQCYEGLDESKALYEWNYRKQLLRISADPSSGWNQIEEDIFSEDFLLARPLLAAISSPDPVVLLVDELDRVEMETEALLLEVLSEYQITIPELGTVEAGSQPLVILTSNNTRDLSEALRRRCLFLHIPYPSPERERAILLARTPGLSETLAEGIASVARSLRGMAMKKAPSVSESIDWAKTLVTLGVERIDRETFSDTAHILLKYQGDIELARKELAIEV